MRKKSMQEAMIIVVDFTVASIRATAGGESHWCSVRFEQCLGSLSAEVL